MAADIPATLNTWSATEASNQPDNLDSMGPNTLADNLRRMQAVVKANVAGDDTIASATTCDIGSKEAGYLTVTGTTTIASFGTTGTAGIIKVLRFTGNCPITHNATSMILPGGSSLTVPAGSVVVVRAEGSGNWRVLGFDGTRISFTPTFVASGSTFAYAVQIGLAEIHGSTVHVYIRIGYIESGTTTTGSSLSIAGLPIGVATTLSPCAEVSPNAATLTAASNIGSLHARGSTTSVILYKLGAGDGNTGISPLLDTDLQAGGIITVCMSYFA